MRWSHIHRVPKMSVLGHMLVGAILAYPSSIEIKGCPKSAITTSLRDCFTTSGGSYPGHHLAVKRSIKGLTHLIKQYEKKRMEEEVDCLIPKNGTGRRECSRRTNQKHCDGEWQNSEKEIGRKSTGGITRTGISERRRNR